MPVADDMTLAETPPKRRVSLVEAPTTGRVSPLHYARKTSATSDYSEAPVRRKSALHTNAHWENNVNMAYQHTEEDKHWNGDVQHPGHHGPYRRSVSANSFNSDRGRAQAEEDTIMNSWWYIFCKRCRQKEGTPSWEPKHWQKVCPHPFCPSYRQFARLVALLLVGLLLWGIVYCIMGNTAAPGGQLFGLALLCICANFGGWIATIFTLPALVGMLFVGIVFQNTGLVSISGDYVEVCAVLRRIALVIILTRAGLDMDPTAMRRLYATVLKLGLVPWTVEAAVLAVMTHFLLGLPWEWAFMLGSIFAAVSPAVVVPCLFRLRSKGYGVAKGIPTLIIAVSGIDDAASVAIFGIFHGIMFTSGSSSLIENIILQGPVSIALGIGYGILWGFISKYIPEKDDPFVVPLRVLMLFGGGLIAVFGSDVINFGGAGPLGVVAASFVSSYFWSKQGWDIEDNPAATAFEIFWMIFEPILFGITGTEVKFNEMDGYTVGLGLACLISAVVVRSITTGIIAVRSRLNLKEKIFVSLAWMAKATVQAALGPVALDSVRNSASPNTEDIQYGEQVLLVCVLSIIVTAPIGAILITLSGPRLLTKTTAPPQIPEWRRRSHRPSIRDISIIDEEEEGDNEGSVEEGGKDESERNDRVKRESVISKKDIETAEAKT